DQRVRTTDRGDPAADTPDPRNDGAVVETNDELHAHLDRAVDALDDAHDVGAPVFRWHEVHDANTAALPFELRVEDQSAVAIAPPPGARALCRRDEPAPVVFRTQQRREACRRVEPRDRRPVDRTVTTDERRALAIADECVIFYLESHPRPEGRSTRVG